MEVEEEPKDNVGVSKDKGSLNNSLKTIVSGRAIKEIEKVREV